MTATNVANLLMVYWFLPYGMSTFLLANSKVQTEIIFLAIVCALLEAKRLSTAMYHPQKRSCFERLNKINLICLRHYVSEHQTNRITLVQPFTYAYNMQFHYSKSRTLLSLAFSRHPPAPTLLESDSTHFTDGYAETAPHVQQSTLKA